MLGDIKQSVYPVSYTHLDVYKRQVSPSIALSMGEALPYLAEYPYGCVEQTLNRFLPALVAVSYTHLDVYKRQLHIQR